MPQVAGIKKGFFNCWKNELLDKKKMFLCLGLLGNKRGSWGSAKNVLIKF
jgi:hypothetical protein